MTKEEAKKRLEVWLICGECPEDKQCYDSYLHSTCEYTDYCDEVSLTDAVKVAISALSENKGEWISIDDVMSVFDDFMCGEVDEEGRATFLEMLKGKAESEDKPNDSMGTMV